MTHPHATPRDVVLAALATNLPTTDRPDVEIRADLIVAALVHHGHLPEPDRGDTADVEAAAQWLATESQFPRYTVEAGEDTPPGWRRLLASTADVNVAAAKALSLAVTDPYRDEVIRAKQVLLAWHHARSLPVAP